MLTLLDLAVTHQLERIAVADRLGASLIRLWAAGVPADDLERGWTFTAPAMVSQVVAAQRLAVSAVVPWMGRVDAVSGVDAPVVELGSDVLTDVMGDGRQIGPALYRTVTTTKRLIAGGMPARTAFTTSANLLALIAKSALHDIGRNADNVAAAGKGYTRYVRVVNGGACSRCAVLAGAASSALPFKRHPSCQCSSMPYMVGAKPKLGGFDSPRAYFDSLSRVEQDRVFTEAGADAIRHGADVSKVVNARRGAYTATLGARPDGTPLMVSATSEGTTSRGEFGRLNRNTTTIRLMPEQISKMANGDPARYVDLLKRYGYLR